MAGKVSVCCEEQVDVVPITGQAQPDYLCKKCWKDCEIKDAPSCYGQYSNESEYCRKVCRWAEKCIKLKQANEVHT